jgi:formate-dependent nitrite reductase membrane component NrfD
LLLLVVVFGLLVPLVMSWRARGLHVHAVNLTTASALILAGGFLLRVVIVLSSEFV